jgi:putative transcriptional regulator
MDQVLLGKLLIATPGLADTRFYKTVILICEYSDQATMGLILNKPFFNFKTNQLLKQMKIEANSLLKIDDTFYGGPVHLNQGFIVHSDEKKYSSSECIKEEIIISTSDDILVDISKGKAPIDTKVFLGCAVWDKNQLNNEIIQNSWIMTESKKNLIFYNNKEFSLWDKSLLDIGIDPLKLINYSGNA